jgi:hypothetical protein
MRKLALLLGLTLASLSMAGQTSRVQIAADNQPPINFYENAGNRPNANALLAPLYANDVIIENQPGIDQRHVAISSSYNGWFYSAYTTYAATGNIVGLTLSKSIDQGITWTVIDHIESNGATIADLDLVVTGNDSSNLYAFVSYILYDSSAQTYNLIIDRHDASNNVYINTPYRLNHGNNPINDVAIASDYMLPAAGAAPYSVGLIYSAYNPSIDTVVFIASDNAGTDWNIRQNLVTTLFFTRTVDLSYGVSQSDPNGKYFAVWEQLLNITDINANIHVSRTQANFAGTWANPQNLDSTSALTNGQCRNPKIATSFSNFNNNSGGITAMVVFERQFQSADYDVSSFYTLNAENASTWQSIDLNNSPNQELQPDIAFDPSNLFFLATAYDSTAGNLVLFYEDFNVPNQSWITFPNRYNDLTNNLSAPWPKVAVDHSTAGAINAWIAEDANNNGVALFDVEMANSIAEDNNLMVNAVFPNPANTQTNITFHLKTASEVQLVVYNALGQAMQTQTINANVGKNQAILNVENLPAGIYMIQLQAGNQTTTKQLVIVQ